jgi:iron complex outermembrane recepter protein
MIPEPQGLAWKRGGLPAWKGDAVVSDPNGGGSPGRQALVALWLVVAVVLTIMPAGAQTPDPIEDEPVDRTESPPDIQGIDDDGSPFFFGEIVVVDEGGEPPSGTTDVLDAAAIQAAGVVTIGQALELLPGVSMSVGGRNEQKVWVRGYDQSNVLLLVDGVPISDPYYGDLDLGQLPIFDVARVSVTRGAASPLYGPNGLGGVINITTMQGGPANRIAGGLRLTSERTAVAHASIGGGDLLSWYFGLGGETSDGWPMAGGFEETPFQDGGVRVNSDLRQATAMGRVGWKIPDAGTLYASLRFIDAEKGIPFHTTEPVGFIKFARFPEWRQTTLALGYEHEFARGQLRAQVYGHGFENTLEVFADPELEILRLESSFSDRVYGGYVQGEWGLGGGHRLGTALHLRQDRHLKTERYPDGSEDPSESYRAWTWSLSAEDRWRIDERNSLIASLALEGLDVIHAESLREADGDPALMDDARPSETLLSPQIEFRRVLGADWTGSVALYHRGRFPTMRQLYGTDPPNPDLGPQRTTGLDFGGAFSPSAALILEGTLFLNRVTDLITREGRDFPYRNQDEAEIRGIELRLRGESGVFEYSAGWTGLDHRFTNSSEGFEEIPFVPDHQIELLGVVHLGRRVDLRGVWLATGRRVAYNGGERLELDGYSVLDLGITGRVGVFELTLQIDNVLDAAVEMEPGYPLPGRRVWVGCRFVLNP